MPVLSDRDGWSIRVPLKLRTSRTPRVHAPQGLEGSAKVCLRVFFVLWARRDQGRGEERRGIHASMSGGKASWFSLLLIITLPVL